MKSAKEMFEELGYKLFIDDKEIMVYNRGLSFDKTFVEIIFDKEHKFLNVHTEDKTKLKTITTILNMQEQKAIEDYIKRNLEDIKEKDITVRKTTYRIESEVENEN